MTAPEDLNRLRGLPFFGLGGHYTTGQTFFVDSGHSLATDSVGWGTEPSKPFATIDYAVGQCTASNGDVIYVMPGHAESVTAASGIDLDVAGISVIGLGNANNRPTLTYTTATTATMVIGADDVKVANINFVCGVDSLGMFISQEANDFTLEDCYFEGGATYQFLCGIRIETTYDGFTGRRLRFDQSTDPGGTDAADDTGIIFCEDSENIFLDDVIFRGNFETGFFHNKTTKAQNVWMRRIYGYNALSTAVPITLVDTSTGGITDSLIISPNATDIAVANIVGVPGSLFYLGRTANFGNDSGGGQLAAFGDAEAS